MRRTHRLLLGLASACVALAGCVTINIYFPAAAAEKAADKIIDEVWQLGGPPGASGEKPPAK
jgi:predicted aminopeptidase